MRIPDVSYARSGDVAIAYQVIGSGASDVVFLRGLTGDLVSTWEQPLLVRHVEGLASNGRLLMLDRRGTGLSDRLRAVPSVETSMDDIRAVMDAEGSERAVIWTGATGTAVAALFAATYPERVAGLVLFDPRACGVAQPDYPWAPSEAQARERLATMRRSWGERGYMEELAREYAPEVADDGAFVDWLVWHLRRSLSPGAALTAARFELELDVRDVLSAVRVPTLLLPHPERPAPAHYVAERIQGSKLVELPPLRGLYTWTDDACHEVTMEATADFIASLGPASEPERVLATILFTDIVGSTELTVRLGDARWRELLERHHRVVRRSLVRYSGREIDTSGDGFFASFDGPARAVRAALTVVEELAELGIDVRAGLHTAEFEIADGKLAGIGASIGARIAAAATAGEVLVSSTLKDLVAGSGIRFEQRGVHQLKGVPDGWMLYAAKGSDPVP
jgi:class 3 adenylate cyclase/alpha-beta hydrolase superfamily lysophospholipase